VRVRQTKSNFHIVDITFYISDYIYIFHFHIFHFHISHFHFPFFICHFVIFDVDVRYYSPALRCPLHHGQCLLLSFSKHTKTHKNTKHKTQKYKEDALLTFDF